MKRRLSRAKNKIKATGIPFAVPDAHLLPERLDAVLAVLYLIYNEGYRGRVDLASEAIRLTRVLVTLMPDEGEAHGLLALMLIHHARRDARFAGDDLVLLEDQDRSLWDQAQLADGQAELDRAGRLGGGAYTAQAAIASLQTASPIDWPQVVQWYDRLVTLTTSPVVLLNRAAAMAQTGDVAGALATVDALDGLGGYLYFHSTRGELLRRLGRVADARCAYDRALELATTTPEQRFLVRRLAEL